MNGLEQLIPRRERPVRRPARRCFGGILLLAVSLAFLGSIPGNARTASVEPSPVVEPAGAGTSPSTNSASSTPATESTSTNSLPAPQTGSATNTGKGPDYEALQRSLPTQNLVNTIDSERNKEQDRTKFFREELETGRRLRRENNLPLASKTLVSLVESQAPAEIRRPAMLELALVAQDQNQLARAQQIYAQYLLLYPQDPSVPEILLRQGLVYRQMGVNNLAVSKFYAVMTSSLTLKLDQFDYYKRLVLQAQTEIADTFYLQGNYKEAADFFVRLLRQNSAELNQRHILFKLIRALSYQGRHTETAAEAESFLTKHLDAPEEAEVRFLLATSLHQVGRTREAMQQVLALLAKQEKTATENPEGWTYWQQRAGNDIANQLYKQGHYIEALEVYLSLSELDTAPAWQLPVWYQIGLVYERLLQPAKASETYDRIIGREKDLTGDQARPGLRAVIEMAKWRKDYVQWLNRTELATATIAGGLSTNSILTAPTIQ